MPEHLQIVIASSGAGHVLRGYEIFAADLYTEMKEHFQMRFCRGGGLPGDGEHVLWAVRRGAMRNLVGEGMAERVEQATFAASLLAYLARTGARVIHVSEPWTARILQSAKAHLPFDYKVIYTNGGGATPRFMQQFDFVHTNSFESYRLALEHGFSPNRIWFVPNAIHFDAFALHVDRIVLRQKYGIPQGAFVILAVSALRMSQKRLDYLVREVSDCAINDCWLLIAGDRCAETSQLEDLALSLLGNRFRCLTVPHQEMPEIYGLADVLVHSSLSEGAYPPFALVEAIAAGLPVLAHRSPGFHWVFESDDWLVDMNTRGSLAIRIRWLRNSIEHAKRAATLLRQAARARFDWGCARRDYISMYSAVLANGNPATQHFRKEEPKFRAGHSG